MGCSWPSGHPCLHCPWDSHRGAPGRCVEARSSPLRPAPPQGPSRNLLLNGKAYPTKVRLIRGGSLPPVKRRRMNWIDAPDDVFYMATEETRWGGRAGGARGARGSVLRCAAASLRGRLTARLHRRKIRKLLSSSETKRAARRPYKPIALRPSQALPLRPPAPAPVNDEPIVIED